MNLVPAKRAIQINSISTAVMYVVKSLHSYRSKHEATWSNRFSWSWVVMALHETLVLDSSRTIMNSLYRTLNRPFPIRAEKVVGSVGHHITLQVYHRWLIVDTVVILREKPDCNETFAAGIPILGLCMFAMFAGRSGHGTLSCFASCIETFSPNAHRRNVRRQDGPAWNSRFPGYSCNSAIYCKHIY